MNIFFTHKTALEYWQGFRRGVFTDPTPVRANPPLLPPNTKALQKDTPHGLASPLHITVAHASARKKSKAVISHVFQKAYPRGSYVKTREGYFVASPELCFLQMAGSLAFEDLVKLAFEFCGLYVLDSEEDRGFWRVAPLTSASKLMSFVKKMHWARNSIAARRAIKYVVDNAASPRETILTLMLTLPINRGGFGFRKPQLNAEILNKNTQDDFFAQQQFFCDLFWRKAGLAVEYDSDAHHTGADRISADAIRRGALSLLGITVVTVTNKQMKYSLERKRLARLLAKHLGKQLRYQEPDFTERNVALYNALTNNAF